MKELWIASHRFQIDGKLFIGKAHHELESDTMYFKIALKDYSWKVVKALSKTMEGVIDVTDTYMNEEIIIR